MKSDSILEVLGARVHNLQNIDITIPRNQLVVFTGLSGSGKSSLAFDTIYAEGQRRYMETFSAYARNFIGNMERPDVDRINGLSPVISIEQKTTNKNPRSTVGTVTEIYDFVRLLYARIADAYSPTSGKKMVKLSTTTTPSRRSSSSPHWCVVAKATTANCSPRSRRKDSCGCASMERLRNSPTICRWTATKSTTSSSSSTVCV